MAGVIRAYDQVGKPLRETAASSLRMEPILRAAGKSQAPKSIAPQRCHRRNRFSGDDYAVTIE